MIEIRSKIAGPRRRKLAPQNEDGPSILRDALRLLQQDVFADFGCRRLSATWRSDESHRYSAKVLQLGVSPDFGCRQLSATWRSDESHRYSAKPLRRGVFPDFGCRRLSATWRADESDRVHEQYAALGDSTALPFLSVPPGGGENGRTRTAPRKRRNGTQPPERSAYQ